MVHNANWLLTSMKSDPNLDVSLPFLTLFPRLPVLSTHLNHTRCDEIHSGRALSDRRLMTICKCWGRGSSIPIPLDGTFPPARSAFRQCPVQSCLRNQRLANLITCCFVFRIQAQPPIQPLSASKWRPLIIEVHCWFLHDHRSSGTRRK